MIIYDIYHKTTIFQRLVKLIHHPDLKLVHGTYTHACFAASNPDAATFNVKGKYETVLDMVKVFNDVSTVVPLKNALRATPNVFLLIKYDFNPLNTAFFQHGRCVAKSSGMICTTGPGH